MPLSFVLSTDAYYFGVVPVIAATAGQFGATPVHIAQVSVLGQAVHALSPIVPAGYLMSGMVGRELGELQRFCLLPALMASALMIVVTLISQALS
jgi:CitMHS family citrate-Mg2+:H+ or citrate-Ca2+:H+ symporter